MGTVSLLTQRPWPACGSRPRSHFPPFSRELRYYFHKVESLLWRRTVGRDGGGRHGRAGRSGRVERAGHRMVCCPGVMAAAQQVAHGRGPELPHGGHR